MTLEKDKEMLLTITINSDKAHAPVKIQVKIPQQLATILMSQAVTTIGIGISTPTGIIEDKSEFVDFGKL